MIHFFPKFGSDPSASPFASELRRLGVPHRLFAAKLNRSHQSRAALVLRIYPALLWLSLRLACRSLLSSPAPEAVVISSDVEALVFGILARLCRVDTKIVFETFIATPKRSAIASRLHHLYYRLVLCFVDLAVCHSSAEAASYARSFAGVKASFSNLPYGMSVTNREALRITHAEAAAASNVIVAAGRSGRDYKTLADAIRGLPCQLRIICDWQRPIVGVEETDQVTILRGCFGSDYLAELAKAKIVVVPLALEGISAGQMVLLQAFALGKAAIVTKTATTPEYAVDQRDALFVKFADVADMREKIELLLKNQTLCDSIGERAAARFERDFSTEAYVAKLVAATRQIIATARPCQVRHAAGQPARWNWRRYARTTTP